MVEIALDMILPNPDQPRSVFDEIELMALADSMREHGLLMPISVEGPVADDYYIILDGERRYRAARKLEWAQIACTVRPLVDPSSDGHRLILALVGNLQRADMGPVDEARAYQNLRAHGMSVEKIAAKIGYSTSHIYGRLSILDSELAEEVLNLLNRRKLPMELSVLRALRRLSPQQQILVVQRAATSRSSAVSIRAACTRILNATPLQQRRLPAYRTGTPALDYNGALGAEHAEIVKEIIGICNDCGMGEEAGAICRDCPLTRLVQRLRGEGNG